MPGTCQDNVWLKVATPTRPGNATSKVGCIYTAAEEPNQTRGELATIASNEPLFPVGTRAAAASVVHPWQH